MTSNIPLGGAGAQENGASPAADAQLRAELLQYFKPEFINRLDDIVRFHSLTRDQISEIVELQVARVVERARRARGPRHAYRRGARAVGEHGL